MPFSSPEGKQEAVAFIRDLSLGTILDVGCGAGAWYDLLSPIWPMARWDGIEIWQPYVQQFGLAHKYDRLHIVDACAVPLYDLRKSYDLAIFGDVIEHLAKLQAVRMVERLPWRRALISVPLGEYPQGPYEGNPYEEHVSTWSQRDVLEAFTVTRQWTGDQLGVFLCER